MDDRPVRKAIADDPVCMAVVVSGAAAAEAVAITAEAVDAGANLPRKDPSGSTLHVR